MKNEVVLNGTYNFSKLCMRTIYKIRICRIAFSDQLFPVITSKYQPKCSYEGDVQLDVQEEYLETN